MNLPWRSQTFLTSCHVQILTSLVSLCLLGIIGLSATPILRSKEDYWTAFDSNGQQPAFSFG